MHNTTELPSLAAGSAFPPPTAVALASRPAPPNEIRQLPMLPRSLPAASPAPVPLAHPFATSLNAPPQPPRQRKSGSGGLRRLASWVIVLGAMGGLAYAGITYGPEIVARVSGDDMAGEAAAPLAFPMVAPDAAPIRTATYTVERSNVTSATTSWTVTSDFESGVAQILLDRADGSRLEVLTLGDEAVIRRTDQDVWYRVARGDMPIDVWSGRIRWVRTIDEALPPAMRSATIIERATESVVDATPTRRLLVGIDAQQLAALLAVPVTDPAADPATAPAPVAAMPPGLGLVPGREPTQPGERINVEVWVDGAGVVRRIDAPAALGGERITVTSVSPDPFQPQFPAEEQILPTDARAILNLAL